MTDPSRRACCSLLAASCYWAKHVTQHPNNTLLILTPDTVHCALLSIPSHGISLLRTLRKLTKVYYLVAAEGHEGDV